MTVFPTRVQSALLCLGVSASRNASAYPVLRAMYGSRAPDFRGLFLRGLGSHDVARASAALGQVQEDQMRPITGTVAHFRINSITSAFVSSGAFEFSQTAPNNTGLTQSTGSWATQQPRLNSALLGHNYAGTETRPANTAVRWMVKALQ